MHLHMDVTQLCTPHQEAIVRRVFCLCLLNKNEVHRNFSPESHDADKGSVCMYLCGDV